MECAYPSGVSAAHRCVGRDAARSEAAAIVSWCGGAVATVESPERALPAYGRDMADRRWLVAVSAAQLAVGMAGQALALRDRRAFDIDAIGWRGRPERVDRDSWMIGTGLSAPVVMLGAQATAIVRLAAGPSHLATRTLGALGVAMIGGHLIEREVRAAMTLAGFDPVVTPLVVAGSGLAVVMAALGIAGAAEH
jgi:hypothetical protein